MGRGRARRSWRRTAVLAIGLGLAAGCASDDAFVERALKPPADPPAHAAELASHYVIHCPDVVAVTVQGPGRWSGPRTVGSDGRIDLGEGVRPRVEGLIPAAAARAVAEGI